MSPWKQLLLNVYYHGSRPYRASYRRRVAARGGLPITVLFYHRVADDRPTDWTVPNDLFRRQIDWLQEHFDLISLEEVQRRLRENDSTRPAVAITFDDGYAENCRHAIPLLVKRRIPCTYFATLWNAQRGQPFAHDRDLGYDFPANTIEQLRAMADSGIEIGCHCRHHDDLAAVHNRDRLHDEIVVAGRELAHLIGHPIRYIAFPFGHYLNIRSDALAMAREAGYRGYCSAYGGYNLQGEDPFHLQRMHVDPDMVRLKNRATIDPRRLEPPRFRTRPYLPISPTPDATPCCSTNAN
ncbi:MAG TPA: polysaccharide deacetylase family protein [Thermoguttaceae bacterium]|nr:polysaccharide deacetylase family protein [Thermoguttaceae bacterium]